MLSQPNLAKLLTIYERLADLGRRVRLGKGEAQAHSEKISDIPHILTGYNYGRDRYALEGKAYPE